MMDYSTINLEKLHKLPLYKMPAGIHLQENPGNGCFMDPPGYPTYFTQSVYNAHGNELRNGPYTVLADPGGKLFVVDGKELSALWLPLPYVDLDTLEGEKIEQHGGKFFVGEQNVTSVIRLAIWMQDVYWYFGGMYVNPELPENTHVEKLVSWNASKGEQYRPSFATVENYRPVTYIREFYQEHQPVQEWIEQKPGPAKNEWVYRYDCFGKQE